MKRGFKLFLILTIVILVIGCSKSTNIKVINGFETDRNQFEEYFILQPNIFIDKLNDIINQKGHNKLSILRETNDRVMYSDNGETWKIHTDLVYSENDFIKIDDSIIGNITQIELSLFSDSEEQAKKNGDYIYALIELFTPGMQEEISKRLYIFENAPDDIDNMRQVIYGNVKYTFIYDKGNEGYSNSSLIIMPNEIDHETQLKPAAIKPSN